LTPYDIARKHHQSDVADFLEKIRKCVLHLLPHEKDMGVAREIIDRADNLDSRRYIGVTPLHIACALGHTDLMRMLLARGASTKYKDPRKRTVLHYAVLHGHTEALKILLAAGAKTTSQDETGKTAEDYARDMYPEMIKTFDNPPEKINFAEVYGAGSSSASSSSSTSTGSRRSASDLLSPQVQQQPLTPPFSPQLTPLERMSHSSGSSMSLLSSPTRVRAETDELREFLDELDVADKAYHVLVANEITDVETLRLMSKQDMMSIGIKLGVALKIVGNL